MGEARASLDTEKRRAEAVGAGIEVSWQDRKYTVHYGEVSATVALELRRQAGLSLNEIWRQLGAGDAGPDTVAILIWIARRIGGETVALASVLEQITSDWTTFQLREVGPTADPADPVTENGEAASPNA